MKALIAIVIIATLAGYMLFPTYMLYAFLALCAFGVISGLRNRQHSD